MSSHSQDHNDDDVKMVRPPAEPGLVAGDEQSPAAVDNPDAMPNPEAAAAATIPADTSTVDSHFALRVPLLQTGTDPAQGPTAFVENLRTKEHVDLCSGCSSKLKVAHMDERMLRRYGFIVAGVGSRVDIPIADFRQMMAQDRGPKARKRKRNAKDDKVAGDDDDERAEEPNGDDDNEEDGSEEDDSWDELNADAERALRRRNKARKLNGEEKRKKSQKSDVAPAAAADEGNGINVDEPVENGVGVKIEVNGAPADGEEELMETEDGQQQRDGNEEEMEQQPEAGQSSSTAGRWLSKKTDTPAKKKTKPLSARQMRVDTEDEDEEEDEEETQTHKTPTKTPPTTSSVWLSKGSGSSGKKMEKDKDHVSDSEAADGNGSDSSSGAAALRTSLKPTRDQYRKNKEVLRLLNENPKKSGDEDEEEADGEGEAASRRTTRQQAVNKDEELIQLLREKRRLHLDSDETEASEEESNNNSNDDDNHLESSTEQSQADSAAANGGGEAEKEKATTSRSLAKKRRRPFNASNSDEDDANDEDYTPGGHKQQPKQPPMMGPSTDGYEVLTLDSGKKKRGVGGPGPVVANGGGGPRKRETAKKRVPTEKRVPTAAKKPRERKISTTTGTTKGRRKKRRNNRVILSDDEEEEEEDENDDEDDEADVEPLPEDYLDRLGLNSDDEEVLPKRGAAKGTRVLDKKKLTVETREAERAERDRRKRLEEKQKEFNGIELVEEPTGEITFTCDQAPVLKAIVLDPDKDGDPPNPVRVHPSLVRVLKKHQAEGIQFLYNCTIESLGQLEKEDSGGGAILGHCMGLGKTLQIIGFLHTILTHSVIRERISRVLIVVPKNVVLNWVHEFDRWLFNNDKDLEEINYVELDQCVTHEERLTTVKHWHSAKGPSVLIIGYEMFRILTLLDEDMPPPGPRSRKKEAPKKKKKKLSANEKTLARLKPYFRRYLHEGPHMVVCDEGHKLKNCETGVFSTMNKIMTRRRICMTGTPLQNKLKEYYCMVNFIKPSLLGNWKEFKIRFASIIEKGRSKDATPTDVRWMRQRCHVLFERLKGVLDRRDYTVLRDSLPPKQEYFINVRLTMPQINLIHLYMEHFGPFLGKDLFTVYMVLYRIWTHPYLLIHHEREVEKKRLRREDDLEMDDFVVEDDEDSEASEPEEEEEEEINADEPSTSNAPPLRRRGRRRALRGVTPSQSASQNAVEEGSPRPETPPELCEWAKNHVSEADRNNFELSNKLMLLVEIIKKCEEIGDKLLVFSQFLDSIGLIERMLAHMEANGEWFADGHAALMAQGERWGWKKRQDYDVIDGSVSSRERDRIQTQFNDPLALRNRLLLISTKAGSLGTNLIGANRVVIFDCCWNPSHDTQALFRIYRFGQVKPVYIYRLVAQGTMEERIYNRQVTKESIAKRVTQAAQIQRHYTEQELGAEADQMYEFNPAMPVDQSADGGGGGAPHLDPPKDRLLGDIILKGADTIVNYQYHDLLFNELEDEALSAEERDEAWQAYERERQGLPPPPIPGALLAANNNVMAAADNNNQWLQQQASIALIQQALQRQQQQSQQQSQQQQQVPSAQRQSQQQLQLLLQQMLLRQRQQQQQQQSGQQPRQQHPNLQAPTTAATTTATPAAAGAVPAFRTALAIAGGTGPPSSALAQQAQFATTMETVFRSYITDSVYNKCMKVKGMTTKMAVQIFQIKQFLRFFVCQVPEDFRPKLGTLNNAEKFEEYFAVLLDRALEQGEDPRQVQRKAWMTLKATVNLVREVPQCLYGINYIARLVPEAFTTG